MKFCDSRNPNVPALDHKTWQDSAYTPVDKLTGMLTLLVLELGVADRRFLPFHEGSPSPQTKTAPPALGWPCAVGAEPWTDLTNPT